MFTIKGFIVDFTQHIVLIEVKIVMLSIVNIFKSFVGIYYNTYNFIYCKVRKQYFCVLMLSFGNRQLKPSFFVTHVNFKFFFRSEITNRIFASSSNLALNRQGKLFLVCYDLFFVMQKMKGKLNTILTQGCEKRNTIIR